MKTSTFLACCAVLGVSALAAAQTPPPPAPGEPLPAPAQAPLPPPAAAETAPGAAATPAQPPAPPAPQPAAPGALPSATGAPPAGTTGPSLPPGATPQTAPPVQPPAARLPGPAPAPADAPPASGAPAVLEIEGLVVEPGGLTAEETVRRALAVSSSAAEKQAEIDAANARIRQTFIEFVPRLGLKASYMRTSPVDSELGGALVGARTAGRLTTEACDLGTCVVDSAGDPVAATSFSFPTVEDNFAVTASLAIPLSDYLLRLSDASAGARASREAAQYALRAAESKVRTDARVLYYNWLRAHAQVYIAEKALERARARLEDARNVFSVGKLANADVLRIEALVANGEAALQQAAAMRALIGAQLAIIMRDRAGGEYAVGSRLPLLEAEELPADGVRRLTDEALAQRLELRSIDAAIDALEHGRAAVRAGGYPRLDAVGEVTYANPNPRYFPPESAWNASWAVGVVASFNVEAPFAGSARADELAAQVSGARAQRASLEAAVVNEVVTAQLELVRARAVLKAGEVAVRAYEEANRVATDLFRVGRGTTSDLIDAENDLLNAKLAIADARIDLTIAVTRLEYALGREARAARPEAGAR